MRPTAEALFAFYHLGLDANGTYKFRNLADCGRQFNASSVAIQQWLREAHIDADTVTAVPFNLTRFHVDAQFVAAAEAAELVRSAWQGYQAALALQQPEQRRGEFRHDVNYDDIWGDGRSDAGDL